MRTKTIKKNFWLSYEEDRQLKYLSSLLNLNEAETIRKLLYEVNIKSNPPKKFYDAIEKINKIGININQLTKVANTTNKVYVSSLNKQFNELTKLVKEIRERYI